MKPALYSKWLAFPDGVRQEMLERLKALKGFRFKRHKHYNLVTRRLRAIEDFLQKRIIQIEQFGEKADNIFRNTAPRYYYARQLPRSAEKLGRFAK